MFKPLISVAGLIALAAAQSHPIVQPELDWGRMESDMRNHMNPTHSNWDYWGAGWIPEACKSAANGYGLNPFDFTVFNVHYDDCPEAWIFCRHKDAPASEIDMIDMFGRIPVHMRSYVRQFIATPLQKDGAAAWTNNFGDVLTEVVPDLHILTHELSHSLDWHALPQYGSPFSDSNIWKDNFNQDKASVSDYSRTSWMENFAEVGIVGIYDKVVPGGIGNLEPNWGDIFHQYATYQGFLGDNILPGGTCRSKLGNSEVVPMSNSAKQRRALGPKPDVSYHSNITEITVDPNTPLITLKNFGDY